MGAEPPPRTTSGFPGVGYPDLIDLSNYRILNSDGTWYCAYAGCKSQKAFTRDCDFRKHFKYHIKYLACREPGCPQAVKGSFATARDRVRHESKHKPNVHCRGEGMHEGVQQDG